MIRSKKEFNRYIKTTDNEIDIHFILYFPAALKVLCVHGNHRGLLLEFDSNT
jgi:hypothetical protein